MDTIKPEIMAPAGSFESLRAAIKAGANSIYFGVGSLNMRARAANFTQEDLLEVVTICNDAGVDSYLTLNTIVYDSDIVLVQKALEQAKDAGISAVIAMDMAVIQRARELAVPVHLSTQVNVTNIESVKHYARFADVIVLARELKLEQIKHICEQIRQQNICGPAGELVKVEAFVHGALCIAISGKCYMSIAQFDHSANRGDCLQTCRRTYTVTDDIRGQQMQLDNEYVMSPSDLCTLGMLDKLVETGVSVLKIEGRGRSPEYVFTVVDTYRKAVDDIVSGHYNELKKQDYIERVCSVFNRGFWQGGYYLGHKTGEWSEAKGTKATERKKFIGLVTNYYARNGVGEFQLQSGDIALNDRLLVTGPTTGIVYFDATSIHGDNGPGNSGKKGEIVGVPVPEKVRPNDKLFVICKNVQS